MLIKGVWNTFKVFRKIKQISCVHYWFNFGLIKTPFLRLNRFKLICDNCGKIQYVESKELVEMYIKNSERQHGYMYSKLKNGLEDGSIDVTKLDI